MRIVGRVDWLLKQRVREGVVCDYVSDRHADQ